MRWGWSRTTISGRWRWRASALAVSSGAAVAIMVAPKSGRELRYDIMDKGRDLIGRGKDEIAVHRRTKTPTSTPHVLVIVEDEEKAAPIGAAFFVCLAFVGSLARRSRCGGASERHAAEDAQLGLGAQLELAHALAADAELLAERRQRRRALPHVTRA